MIPGSTRGADTHAVGDGAPDCGERVTGQAVSRPDELCRGEEIVTDVLVLGAGASGVCAAVAAARTGVRVVLTNEDRWIGGMLTAAGVSAIDGNHRLPSGLWGEFRRRICAAYRARGVEDVASGWVSNTLFSPAVGHEVLQRMVAEEERITLLTGMTVGSILYHDAVIAGALFSNGVRVHASQTILADEYGDMVELAGLPWCYGIESRHETGESCAPDRAWPYPQDLTWVATVRAPRRLPPRCDARSVTKGPFVGLLGEPPLDWQRFIDYGRLPEPAGEPRTSVMLNWPIHGNDVGGDYLDVTQRPHILAAAQRKTLSLVALLQQRLGSEAVTLEGSDLYGSDSPSAPGLARIPYVREARRHVGVHRLTVDDLLSEDQGRHAAFSVAVGDYPLDHHREEPVHGVDGVGTAGAGRREIMPALDLPAVPAYSVPYGVLVPHRHDGVLVAEKSVSVTGLANGCTRLQPVVMQLGEAAGVAAALCVLQRIQPRTLDVRHLQHQLLHRNGWLRPYGDVSPDDTEFTVIQWLAVHGLVRGTYRIEGWANGASVNPHRRLARADAARIHAHASRIGLQLRSSRSDAATLRSVARQYRLPAVKATTARKDIPWKPLFLT